MTLGRAAQEQVYLIACCDCGHKAQIDLVAMAAKFGESAPLAKLRPSLKCRCGSKNTISTTLWLSATTTEAFVRRWLER